AMIVLVAGEREVLQYVATADLALFDFLEKQEKPTTVVYDGAIGFADNLVSQDGSIAIRICRDEFCRHLIRRFRKPIVSTSANFAGKLSPACFYDIDHAIVDSVEYVVKYIQNEKQLSSASAIIRWKNGEVEW